MELSNVRILETVVLLFVYILLHLGTKTVINNFLKHTELQRGRRKIIIKAINLLVTFITMVFLAAIWGLKQNQIAVFASTIITAIGIAFFAQWSLLSNITAGIILFFNHPLRIGHTIEILEKDNTIIGEITDLTYFFIHLQLPSGDVVTLPNSLVLQKNIAVKKNPSKIKPQDVKNENH